MGNRLASYSNPPGTYTVVKNDTLWWICSDLLVPIQTAASQPNMSINQAMTWVANKNNMKSINEYLYKDQVLAIEADPSTDPDSSSTAVVNVKNSNSPVITYFGRAIPIPEDVESYDPINDPEDLSNRTLLAIWTWQKETETAEYVFNWKYTNGLVDSNGDAIWFNELGSNSIDEEHKSDRRYLDAARQTTWEIPDDATYVQFEVAAVSRTHEVNGKDTKYWSNTSYTQSVKFNVNNISLEAPSAPTVEMIGQLQLQCTMENVNVKATKVQFEVWKNNSERYATAVATVTPTRTVTYVTTLVKSSSYKVKCRISNGVVWSNWSDFTTDSIKTVADAPVITTLVVEPTNTSGQDTYLVDVEWTRRETANAYILEYIQKEVFSGTAQDGSFLPNAESITFTVDDVNQYHPTATTLPASSFSASGAYYFHMRSKTGDIYSDWSATKTITVGTRPEPPTTWSSNTTVVIDTNELSLFWVHNPTDGSVERRAAIYWSFGTATPSGDIAWDAWSDASAAKTIINNRTGKKRYELSEAKVLLSSDGTEKLEQTDDGPARIRLLRSTGQTYLRWCVKTLGAYYSNNVQEKYGYSENSTIRIIRLYSQPEMKMDLHYADVWISLDQEVHDYDPIPTDESIQRMPIAIRIGNASSDQSAIAYYIKISTDEAYSAFDEYGKPVEIKAGDAIFEATIPNDAFPETPYDVSRRYTWHGVTSDIWYVFEAVDLFLQNGVSYTFFVEMTTDAGLKVSMSESHLVSWDRVYELFPNAQFAENKKAVNLSIMPYCTDEDNEPFTAAKLWVFRREFDGGFTTIAEDLDASGNVFVIDPHPALNLARYRILAKETQTGQVFWTDTPGYPINIPEIIIQWDEEWQSFTTNSEDPLYNSEYTGSMVRLPYNIDVSESTDRDIALVDYIGRENPVSYYGTKIGVSGSWSTEIPKYDTDTIYALRRLARWMGDCYVREPSGIGYWASVTVSFSQTHNEVTIPITIEVKKVEGGI